MCRIGSGAPSLASRFKWRSSRFRRQRLAADASLIEADANKQNSTPKEDWDHNAIDPADTPRAVKEYLDVLDDAASVQHQRLSPSLRLILIPQASGRQPVKAPHSSVIPPTI